MKAIYFESPGRPEKVLRYGWRPEPLVSDGDVLIRVLASSINPADFYFIAGTYIESVYPQIAGIDGVGLICESYGSHKKNDLVAFRHPGAWAEYIAVPSHKLIPLPANFPIEKGAQLILNAGTAWGLLDRVELMPEEWLILSAGTSAVSKITSQMAHRRGIRVISVVRHTSSGVELGDYGADAVIELVSHNGTQLSNEILKKTDGAGVAAFFDSVGGPSASAIMQAMQIGGTVLVYGLLDPEPVSYYNSQIIYKQMRIEGFRIMPYLDGLQDMQATFREIIEVVRHDTFRIDIHRKFPLENFAAAIEGSFRGKVLFISD